MIKRITLLMCVLLCGCATKPKRAVRQLAPMPPLPWEVTEYRAQPALAVIAPPALVTGWFLEWTVNDPRPSIRYTVKWAQDLSIPMSQWPVMAFADQTNRVAIPPFVPPRFWIYGTSWVPGYLP